MSSHEDDESLDPEQAPNSADEGESPTDDPGDSDERDTDELDSDESASDEPDSDEPDSDELDSDESDSDESDSGQHEAAGPSTSKAGPADGEPPDAGVPLWRRFGRGLAERYATVDPRSLGLFRWLLGALLLIDLLRRYPDLVDHFTNEGWLPNHFAIFRPMSNHLWSLYHAFSTPGEVKVLFWIHAAIYFCLWIGWRTRLMHVLSAVLLCSISSRSILMENGGYVVLILLTVWSMFLPLGRRFSLDSLLDSLRQRRESSVEALNDRSSPTLETKPVVNLAATALLLQWAVIYYFNAVHKNGPPWKDGTAVYYFLQQDRMISPFGGWIRHHLPLWAIKGMSWSALAIEYALPALILTPLFFRRARLLAWALILALHLGIDSMVQLGPFSWAMMVMMSIFVHADYWTSLAARQRKKRNPRRVLLDSDNGLALSLGRLIKRFDGQGLVTFVRSPGYAQGFGVLEEERSDSAAQSGVAGLRSLTHALSAPRFVWFCLYVPGLSHLVDSWLSRAMTNREAVAKRLGVASLPTLPDEIAPPESAARRAVQRTGFWLTQLVVAYLMVAAVSQVLIENRAIPDQFKPKHRPEWLEATIIYPRMFQGWSMFAPQPPNDDGVIVVDAITQDGRHIDPLTGKAPSFEMNPETGYHLNQIWCDWMRRMSEGRFRAYLPGVKDYLLKYHERTGNPNDRIVAFEMWSLHERVPPPGAPRQPPTRNRLVSHGVLKDPLAWPWPEQTRTPPKAPPIKRGRAMDKPAPMRPLPSSPALRPGGPLFSKPNGPPKAP
ncbi:MAG: lipase maturation factor family protein [Polyangiaceae bacterium]|nr:lipase maturation factor family protein [Polyangiaceae bacterium]